MLKVFSVRDVKSDAYGGLICLPAPGLATRTFLEACLAPDSPMAKYPGDFSLYELGTFDSVSGAIVAHAHPVFLMSAVEAIAEARRQASVSAPELPLEVKP